MNALNQTLICNPQIEWSELLSGRYVSSQPFRISSCLNVCIWSWKNARSRKENKRQEKKEGKESTQSQLPGFELALLRQLLASRAWNFTTQLRKQNTRYYVTITRPAVWKRNTSHAVSKANKGKKKVKLILQLSFAKKIKAELIVTFNGRLSWYRIDVAAMQPD